MPTCHIHIEGKVQGIGFRPFVYRLATEMKLTGWVINKSDGVHIEITGDEKTIQTFYSSLSDKAPSLSYIKTKEIQTIENKIFSEFRIIKEADFSPVNLMIPADLSICEECRSEIRNSSSKRFHYGFTTCTNCGPRYSIIKKFPYDREHTSMSSFTVCDTCFWEYNNPEDRRYYSQTNSCHKCAIKMNLFDSNLKSIEYDQGKIITISVNILKGGKILAVKGIGGYLLLADATCKEAVELLRVRKNRPSKPFAVMYPNLSMAGKDVHLREEDLMALNSSESPVVLLQKKEFPASGIQSDLIAPELNRLGVLMPYTPLFELLLSTFNKPLIATSGNLSGNPILFRDHDVLETLSSIADFILCYNREIVLPQDDSVIQFSEKYKKQIILRRSRGYAPSFQFETLDFEKKKMVLALGSDLKSTFAFTSSGNTYISQYLGDLSSYDSHINFEYCLHHLTSLLEFNPTLVAVDKHPDLTSVCLGETIAKERDIPLIRIQHHEAHFAAVMAENKLLDKKETVLGIIWDGLGFGNHNIICGGEFLKYCHNKISTVAQIEPFRHLAGDRMSSEPAISALTVCQGIEGSDELLESKFTKTEWEIYKKLFNAKTQLTTSSMGRIFDAVASLLGLCDKISYEGEAAILLETSAKKDPDLFELPGYYLDDINDLYIPIKGIIRQLIADIKKGIARERMAAQFHVTLVNMIEKAAKDFSISKIAFSGGVFQNSLLVDLCIEKLSGNSELYFHSHLSPNDECISFGQLAWVMIHDRNQKSAINNYLKKTI